MTGSCYKQVVGFFHGDAESYNFSTSKSIFNEVSLEKILTCLLSTEPAGGVAEG